MIAVVVGCCGWGAFFLVSGHCQKTSDGMLKTSGMLVVLWWVLVLRMCLSWQNWHVVLVRKEVVLVLAPCSWTLDWWALPPSRALRELRFVVSTPKSWLSAQRGQPHVSQNNWLSTKYTTTASRQDAKAQRNVTKSPSSHP